MIPASQSALPPLVTADSPWTVCQLGAREHYAIPRALLGTGRPVHLVTDFWAGRRRWAIGRLAERAHPDCRNETVTDFGLSLLTFEALSRLRRLRNWRLIEARNAWFDRQAARCLESLAPRGTLFAYSYASSRTLAAARRLGMRTILGQIDPGPVEVRLVRDRRREAGLLPEPEPSADYWENWRSECRLADAIVVNSSWSKSALEAEGIPADRIHVVPLAFEGGPADRAPPPPRAARPFSPDRPLQVLFLGQIVVRKGLLEIAEAIGRLADLPVRWTFVGGGDPVVLDRLRGLPQTRVLGSVRRQEAGRHYREADIFLLPTHSDGFALTQLEAAAHGLPIIASKHCGDVVRHGENGLLLEAVTSEAIVDAVQSILREPDRLAAFRERQRERPSRTLSDLAQDLIHIESAISPPEGAAHAVR